MTTQTHILGRLVGFAPAATEADWEALYQRELPRIYNFFRYRVGDDATAEDLASATFEKAWSGRARYRRDLAGFSTWLFTIARNTATDHFRRRRIEVGLDEIADRPTESTPEDAAVRRAEFSRLSMLLAALPDRERDLLALKYGADLNNREIARVSGLGESNVGTILHRAITSLRARFNEECPAKAVLHS